MEQHEIKLLSGEMFKVEHWESTKELLFGFLEEKDKRAELMVPISNVSYVKRLHLKN